MIENLIIRAETPADYHNTEAMVRRSFWNKYWPGCTEHLLVRVIRESGDYLPEISRIAELNGRINSGDPPQFAALVFDIEGLRFINETRGREHGDDCLKEACSIICDTFKRSPVFRLEDDEFVSIVQNRDYRHLDELMNWLTRGNERSWRDDGILIACGVAHFSGEKDAEAVFDRARQSLLEDKKRLRKDFPARNYGRR